MDKKLKWSPLIQNPSRASRTPSHLNTPQSRQNFLSFEPPQSHLSFGAPQSQQNSPLIWSPPRASKTPLSFGAPLEPVVTPLDWWLSACTSFKAFISSSCGDHRCLLPLLDTTLGPELGIFLEPLLLHEKELVLLAVNNNPSTEAAGGSHWYCRVILVCFICVEIRITHCPHH